MVRCTYGFSQCPLWNLNQLCQRALLLYLLDATAKHLFFFKRIEKHTRPSATHNKHALKENLSTCCLLLIAANLGGGLVNQFLWDTGIG